MCSIVYSSYLSINSEVKDSRKKNTKTEIKHILHFPHVSKLHQIASPLLAAVANGEVYQVSGEVLIRHLIPLHLSTVMTRYKSKTRCSVIKVTFYT